MKCKWKNSSSTPTYTAWRNMRRRCSNPSDPSWMHYGGRGISVCEQWNSYDQFVADMGLKPEGMTLDRINTNGDYEPGNCAWVSMRDNLNNRRNTVKINDVAVTVLADMTGIKPDTLRARARRYGVAPDLMFKQRINDAKPAEHGTRKRYERDGCRCDLCKQANTERAREYRRQRSSQFALVADNLNGVTR